MMLQVSLNTLLSACPLFFCSADGNVWNKNGRQRQCIWQAACDSSGFLPQGHGVQAGSRTAGLQITAGVFLWSKVLIIILTFF